MAAAIVGPSLPFSAGSLATAASRSVKGVNGAHAVALAGRLFFDDAEIDRFRSLYAGDAYAALRESIEGIDRAAERKFLSTELRYNDHLYDLPRTSKLAMNMAFHYLLTGDEDAAALAVTCMETIQRFPRWDYFLEAGERTFGLQRAPEATVATSLCWEWLADVVDEETRNGWIRTMGDRGCEASWLGLYGMRYPDRVVGWTMDESSTYFEHRPDDRVDLSNWPHILDRTNLKAVPASALAIGAVCYARALGEDERAAKWIEQAIYSLRTFRDLYAVDGSYDEGVSYANYTSSHIAQATVVLERYNGLSLYDDINWSGYVDYLCGMSMGTAYDPRAIVNFGDAGGGATASVPYWVAGRTHDAKARWFGDALAREKDMWALFWDPADVAAVAEPNELTLWQSALDWMVARTGYRPEDLVVAMRSGGPANHEHADRNSITVKWGGEILVTDPYRPPYSFADPSWMMRTTAGHSAVLVDGNGHQYHDGSEGTNASDAVAKIVRVGRRDGFVFWASDATPAYALVDPDVESITRSVYVFEAMPLVLVLDKVRKGTTASKIEARFFADNRTEAPATFSTTSGGERLSAETAGGGRIVIGERGRGEAQATIHRPLASAAIVSSSPSGATASARRLPIPDENAALHPFAAVSTVDPSRAPLLITAIVPHTGAAPDIRFEENERGVTTVVASHGVSRVVCEVLDSGSIPEVSVRGVR